MKCDERKPICTRCVVHGRSCKGAGYGMPLLSTILLERSERPEQPNYAPTPLVFGANEEEKQMFFLFRTEIAPHIAGGFDASFWAIGVPIATQNYTAIWHASIAIAAMYKFQLERQRGSEMPQIYSFALSHYSRSIYHLVKIANRQSLDCKSRETMLLSTVLFTGLCALQGNIKEATVHIRSGISLFYNWRLWEQNDTHDSILSNASLVKLFSHLELQQGLTEAPRTEWEQKIAFDVFGASTTPFESLTEAYLEHAVIHNNMIKLCRNMVFGQIRKSPNTPLPELDERQAYRQQYSAWKARFQHFRNLAVIHGSEACDMEMLDLFSKTTEILLYMNFAEAELGWNRYWDAFHGTVELAEKLYDEEARRNRENTISLCFAPLASTSWRWHCLSRRQQMRGR